MSMTGAKEEALERVPYINIPVWFKNDKTQIQALVDWGSEVNAIYPSFAEQLGLPIRPIDVEAQKIDGTILNTHGMVVAAFSVENKANRVRCFEETFLVTNISPKVVFEIFFLTLSDADVDFSGWEL